LLCLSFPKKVIIWLVEKLYWTFVNSYQSLNSFPMWSLISAITDNNKTTLNPNENICIVVARTFLWQRITKHFVRNWQSSGYPRKNHSTRSRVAKQVQVDIKGRRKKERKKETLKKERKKNNSFQVKRCPLKLIPICVRQDCLHFLFILHHLFIHLWWLWSLTMMRFCLSLH
jgi:hypothetical protein